MALCKASQSCVFFSPYTGTQEQWLPLSLESTEAALRAYFRQH